VLTKARHWTLSWASRIQFAPSIPISLAGKGKVVPVLSFNWEQCHRGVWGSGGTAPRITDLGTRWRWVVSFTAGRFTPREGAPGNHLIGSWVGLRAGLEAVVKRKIPSSCRKPNPPII
jgi:hypothetical protein